MKLALAQLHVKPARVEGNLDRAVTAIEKAADHGADLVALPELFATGYFAFDAYARTAEPIGGDVHERLRETAAEHSIAVLAGSIVEDLAASASAGHHVPEESGLANTSVLFGPDGATRAVYRKHHLFGYDSRESELLTPGERLETAEIGGFTIGMATCYDLRFPGLFRDLLDAGATMVLLPSAWPYPRIEHWNLLPRTRAVENQYVVAAVNGVGTFSDASLLGRSAVYGPWGTKMGGATDEPETLFVDVDPGRIDRVRDEFPALADRR